MKRVLFATRSDRFDWIFPSHVFEELKSKHEIVDGPFDVTASDEELVRNIDAAEIVITTWNSPQLSEELLKGADSLELVAHAAGSVRPIVSDALWERGARVTSAARAIADGVAEFCLGLTLTCSKRVFWYAEEIRNGRWPRGNEVFGPVFEIYRQEVGIIGAGYVGRKFIELLKPFGCSVLLFDPYCSAEDAKALGVEKVDTLDEIFSRCRVVSLHAPVTDETKGMITGSHFSKLPDGALFINTARGVIIKQDEMVAELAKGRFVACLDVTNPEPPTLDDPLRRLPNVILTPHEAGAICENLQRLGEFTSSEIDAYTAGKPMVGEVTKKKLEVMA